MNTPEEIYRSFPDEAMMNNVANIIGRNGWDGLAATVRTARDALVYFRSRPAVPTASGATGDALKAWINQCREKFGHSAFDGKDQWWIGYFEALKDLERFAEKSASRPAVAQEGARDTERLDWLERNGAEVNVDDGAGDGPGFVDVSYFRGNRNDRVKHGGRGHDLRAAIDCAMSSQPEKIQ
jgi:hypothetical protein